MHIETRSRQNSIGDITDLHSITSEQTPTQRSRSTSIDPRSSIGPSGGSSEPKSFLTRVYEGFCHILALIWNFFSSPQETPPASREGSLKGSNTSTRVSEAQVGDLFLDDLAEEHFALKGSQDGSDQHSVGSGFGSTSDTSGILVDRPSDASSHQSSDIASSGSNPLSQAARSSNTDSLIEEALYALSDRKDSTKEAALLNFCDRQIPKSLEITAQNRADIREVLKTIGENTAWGLGLNAVGSWFGAANQQSMIPRLKDLGASIDRDVHPYRFLIEIFTDDDSKRSLLSLHKGKNDPISGRTSGRVTMWSEFITGLGKNFENRKKDIRSYTDFFAQAIKQKHRKSSGSMPDIDPAKIDSFVTRKNWNGLLDYLIKETTANDL